MYLNNEDSSRLDFLSSRNNDIKMVKIVNRNLSGVSNMADQGRVPLQNLSLYNISIEIVL